MQPKVHTNTLELHNVCIRTIVIFFKDGPMMYMYVNLSYQGNLLYMYMYVEHIIVMILVSCNVCNGVRLSSSRSPKLKQWHRFKLIMSYNYRAVEHIP